MMISPNPLHPSDEQMTPRPCAAFWFLQQTTLASTFVVTFMLLAAGLALVGAQESTGRSDDPAISLRMLSQDKETSDNGTPSIPRAAIVRDDVLDAPRKTSTDALPSFRLLAQYKDAPAKPAGSH